MNFENFYFPNFTVTQLHISAGCFIGEAQFFYPKPLTSFVHAFTDVEFIYVKEQHMSAVLARASLMKSIIRSLSIKFDMDGVRFSAKN